MIDQAKTQHELQILHQLDTELGTIKIFSNLVIMEAREGAVISFRTGIFILLQVISLVGIRPVVYISHRINKYSVDPNDYKYLEMIPHLKGIAVVNYDVHGKRAVELEKRFYNKKFRSFHNLDDAKYWAMELLHS